MSEYFIPYEGRKPYVFVSYAHRDSARVLPVIRPLHEMHYRLWYDEGIPAGSDWPENIALHMRHCAAVLFFVSGASLRSVNCRREIADARRQGKPVLCVRLDDAPLPDDFAHLLAGAPIVPLSDAPMDTARRALDAGVITEAFLGDGTSDPGGVSGGGRFNGWILATVLGALLLLAAVAGAYGLNNGWFDVLLPAREAAAQATAVPTGAPTAVPTPAPTVDVSAWGTMFNDYAAFPDKLQERAVRAAIGQSEGDVLTSELLSVTQLHFCGNMALHNDAGIAFDENGACSVNGAPVIQGPVSDLSLLADMPALTTLTLAQQSVTSIKPLGVLTQLSTLNAAGNPIRNLNRLTGFASLATLHIEHTQIADLTPLNDLPRLAIVTVSADMFPLVTDPETQRYDIVLVR